MNKQQAAGLIARFMKKIISGEEIVALDAWIEASEENMHLFELVIEEKNMTHARKWFTAMGVDNSFLDSNEWHTPSGEFTTGTIGYILHQLEKRYMTVVRYDGNSLQSSTIKIPLRYTLQQALEALKKEAPVDYEIKEDGVYIRDNKGYKK